MKTFATSLPKAVFLLFAIAAFVGLTVYQQKVVQPRSALITADFLSATPTDVLSLRISPASYSTLVSHTIVIPPELTKEFFMLIRDAHPFQPNHPADEWICEMSLSTRQADFAARISATSNNGLLIYLDGGATLRCDSLRAFLEEIARSQPNVA